MTKRALDRLKAIDMVIDQLWNEKSKFEKKASRVAGKMRELEKRRAIMVGQMRASEGTGEMAGNVFLREYAVSELDKDVEAGRIRLDPRLSDRGRIYWVPLLRKALEKHDAKWLGEELKTLGYLVTFERALHPKKAEYCTRRVPFNAHTELAEREWGRMETRARVAAAVSARLEYVRAGCSRYEPQVLLEELRLDPYLDVKAFRA